MKNTIALLFIFISTQAFAIDAKLEENLSAYIETNCDHVKIEKDWGRSAMADWNIFSFNCDENIILPINGNSKTKNLELTLENRVKSLSAEEQFKLFRSALKIKKYKIDLKHSEYRDHEFKTDENGKTVPSQYHSSQMIEFYQKN